MLSASSGKCNVRSGVHPSVRLSLPSAYSPWLTRGSMRRGQSTPRPDCKDDRHTRLYLVEKDVQCRAVCFLDSRVLGLGKRVTVAASYHDCFAYRGGCAGVGRMSRYTIGGATAAAAAAELAAEQVHAKLSRQQTLMHRSLTHRRLPDILVTDYRMVLAAHLQRITRSTCIIPRFPLSA